MKMDSWLMKKIETGDSQMITNLSFQIIIGDVVLVEEDVKEVQARVGGEDGVEVEDEDEVEVEEEEVEEAVVEDLVLSMKTILSKQEEKTIPSKQEEKTIPSKQEEKIIPSKLKENQDLDLQ